VTAVRDYARKQTHVRKSKRRVVLFFLLFLLVLIGLTARIQHHASTKTKVAAKKTITIAKKIDAHSANNQTVTTAPIKYDFYQLLPKMSK